MKFCVMKLNIILLKLNFILEQFNFRLKIFSFIHMEFIFRLQKINITLIPGIWGLAVLRTSLRGRGSPWGEGLRTSLQAHWWICGARACP